MVVVEVAYRLGTYGFLAIPGTDIKGNFGIGDQITGLEVLYIIDQICECEFTNMTASGLLRISLPSEAILTGLPSMEVLLVPDQSELFLGRLSLLENISKLLP